MPPAKLARISFRDSERQIHVSGYADMLVYDEISHLLVTMRYGGYPEAVRALADAIGSGGTINVELEEDSFKLYTTPKFYEKIVEDGLAAGCIAIPGADPQNKGCFRKINGVMDYLEAFGVLIAEKIKSSFKPLYDPSEEGVSSKILKADDYLFANKRIRLYPAQKAVAESVKRKLDNERMAMIIASCGSVLFSNCTL